MAIFGKSEKKAPVAANTNSMKNMKSIHSTTIITECMEIKGDIKGCGTAHIDGTIHGNINVDDSVVIGEKGHVYGNIYSKKVIISGTLEGSITCDSLDVTLTGHVTDKVKARTINSDGKIEAVLYAENEIHITQNGKVATDKMQSKHIIVNGDIQGNVVASELLEINKDGQVKGEMVVKKIKVSEGGLMLGTMLTYEATNTVKTVSENKADAHEEIPENTEKEE